MWNAGGEAQLALSSQIEPTGVVQPYRKIWNLLATVGGVTSGLLRQGGPDKGRASRLVDAGSRQVPHESLPDSWHQTVGHPLGIHLIALQLLAQRSVLKRRPENDRNGAEQ